MNVAERLDPADIDVGQPNIERVCDAFLGGTDNFAADRPASSGVCLRWRPAGLAPPDFG
jgi:hypothetical protein